MSVFGVYFLVFLLFPPCRFPLFAATTIQKDRTSSLSHSHKGDVTVENEGLFLNSSGTQDPNFSNPRYSKKHLEAKRRSQEIERKSHTSILLETASLNTETECFIDVELCENEFMWPLRGDRDTGSDSNLPCGIVSRQRPLSFLSCETAGECFLDQEHDEIFGKMTVEERSQTGRVSYTLIYFLFN